MKSEQLPLFQEEEASPSPYPELKDPAQAFDLRKALPFIIKTAALRASEDYLRRYPELRESQDSETESTPE